MVSWVVCFRQKTDFSRLDPAHGVEMALKLPPGQIFVIPVRLDDCEVPREFKKWQYVALFTENGLFKLRSS